MSYRIFFGEKREKAEVLISQGLSDETISHIFGCSKAAVKNLRQKQAPAGGEPYIPRQYRARCTTGKPRIYSGPPARRIKCRLCKDVFVIYPSWLKRYRYPQCLDKGLCSKCWDVIAGKSPTVIKKEIPWFRTGITKGRFRVLKREGPGKARRHLYRSRLVAECALGRNLKWNEVVIHIDDNLLNDERENLLVVNWDLLSSLRHFSKEERSQEIADWISIEYPGVIRLTENGHVQLQSEMEPKGTMVVYKRCEIHNGEWCVIGICRERAIISAR